MPSRTMNLLRSSNGIHTWAWCLQVGWMRSAKKICKIISLLSQALVLALSLMKAMVSTQQVPSNNCVEHMLEEEQLIHPELGQHDLLEPANSNRPRRGRPVSNITFARGQGFWSGYGGAGVDDAGSVQGNDITTVEW